ncbi:MAG: hypothetical protein JWP52_3884 [Rhizobacter sp.]|jgi:hypothetical protein|nr:hypothetical protein [Rhizobacter sp.]
MSTFEVIAWVLGIGLAAFIALVGFLVWLSSRVSNARRRDLVDSDFEE